jgi:predicted DNA-binding transcriptional regulator YafY
MKAVPAPFQPAAAAASQRILVDAAGWMRGPDAVGQLGVLQAAVFTDRRLRLRYRSSGQPAARKRIVDPYGLVCKSGIWYLVADSAGEPRLFRVSRAESAQLDEAPVVRRDGMTLAVVWEELRRQVEDRPGRVAVTVRVRRSRLDLLSRIHAANLAGPVTDDADPEWAVVPLRFPVLPAARSLLTFGADVEVLSPGELRADLAAVAAAVVTQYSGGAIRQSTLSCSSECYGARVATGFVRLTGARFPGRIGAAGTAHARGLGGPAAGVADGGGRGVRAAAGRGAVAGRAAEDV